MRPLLAIFACSFLCVAAESPEPCDPVATADWLSSVFTVRDGKVLVVGKEPDKYFEARLRFPKPVEIQTYGRQIIADQEGLYPMIIGPTEGGYEFQIYTPFYVFMDEITESDGLPGYAPHPKAEAINEKGFRKIAEKLHSHFTQRVGSRPECFRVMDEIGYPSEHYIWTIGTTFIILAAYDGNDSNGIYLDITSSSKRIDRVRKMRRTTEEVFEGWGDPMPSLSPKQPK